jgi:hypothetical protein
MHFGTGSDTLTLAGPAAAHSEFITGLVDLGGPPGGNQFVQGTGWDVLQPWTLQNV